MNAARLLPVLDNIHIAAPCKADWAEMVGDDRARFCGKCEKNVYNLSEMSRMEAQALLIAKEGKLCVRYYQRADGTVITGDCPDGVRRRNRKRRIVAVTFGAMSAIAAAASFVRAPIAMQGAAMPIATPPVAQTPAPVTPPEPDHVEMGKMAARVPEPVVAPEPMVMGEIAPPMMGRMTVSPTKAPKAHKER